MEKIENLLKEYKIRFRDTDKILMDWYPFDNTIRINEEFYRFELRENFLWNKQGKVYEVGKWATADLKEEPDKWVVEKDESHPMWGRFRKWWISEFSNLRVDTDECFFGHDGIAQVLEIGLQYFTDHQYLTLDQWAEFFLPKYEVGDKVITEGYCKRYDGKVLTITRIMDNGFCYFKEGSESNEVFWISHILRYATKEEIAKSEAVPKSDQLKNYRDELKKILNITEQMIESLDRNERSEP